MITATMPMVYACPYVDELDVGTVALTWPGEAPDLHHVARSVAAYATKAATHEAVTQELADTWTATVTTTWRTAGMDVKVTATPT